MSDLAGGNHNPKSPAKPEEFRKILTLLADALIRMLPDNIVVATAAEAIPTGLSGLRGDARIVEEISRNLAIHARTSMPGGGRITLSAAPLEITPEQAKARPSVSSGRFLCLTIVDTGPSLSPEAWSRISRSTPFTDLESSPAEAGLPALCRLAKRNGGGVEVESQAARGVLLRIFIPALDVESQPVAPPTDQQGNRSTRETILVVEDQPEVRRLVVRILQTRGYEILAAESGLEALELWSKHPGKVDLVVTDLVMPGGISGQELGRRLLKEEPALKIIYTSGYNETSSADDLSFLEPGRFLAKPYSPAKLIEAVRLCLAERLP